MLHVEIHRKIHRKFHYSEVDRYTVLLQHLLHKIFIVIKHCQFVGSGKLFCFFVVGFFFLLHII